MVLLMGAPLSAEVIDSFICRLEYLNDQGEVQEGTVGQLTGIRREMEREDLWGRNIIFTEAKTDWIEFRFGVDGEMGSADLQLRYYHAIELDTEGRAVRAAQSHCNELSLTLPGETWINGCNLGLTEDPFSGHAWNTVEIAPNGIAQFDVSRFPRGISTLDIHCELISSEDR